MAKVRVYELAKELGVESRVVMAHLQEMGHFVRSASSTLEAATVRAIQDAFGQPRPEVREQGANTPRVPNWTMGAVDPPRGNEILRAREALFRAIPAARDHQDAFERLGSQIVYSARCGIQGFQNCHIALVRFSRAIESAFGITREVMVFYTPFADLQIRGFRAGKQALALMSETREVTPDMLFLHAPDPRLNEKLDDWSSGAFMSIPLAAPISDSSEIVSILRDHVFSRDLFYETTPVNGDRFFGRKLLLQRLRDDVRNQRVAGLFGLRKAGKTSVLSELIKQVTSSSVIVLLRDLETLPSPPVDPIPDLVREFVSDLISECESRALDASPLEVALSDPSLAAFKMALQGVLRVLDSEGVRLVLLLDEIEYLTPATRGQSEASELGSIAQFLGVLRSCVQENPNFTFLLSGLTSAIIEEGRLYARPNPLFSWAKTYFLSPLEFDEACSLALNVGQKMGITIDQGALEGMYEASGGHAFLYRHFASHIVGSLPIDGVFHRRMTQADVLRALHAWRLQVAGNMQEMVDHVRRYYPDEAFLLDVLRDDPAEFEGISVDAPLALGHLIGLGLIVKEDNSYQLTPVLQLL